MPLPQLSLNERRPDRTCFQELRRGKGRDSAIVQHDRRFFTDPRWAEGGVPVPDRCRDTASAALMKRAEIAISMDSKGASRDNGFVERLWRKST